MKVTYKKSIKECDIKQMLLGEPPKIIKQVNITFTSKQNKPLHPNKIKLIKDLTLEIEDFITQFNFKEDQESSYRRFKIPKRKGGWRELIEITNYKLRMIQQKVLNTMQNILNILPHECAYAYVKNRSAIDNAQFHKNSNFFIKLDMKNFFPSIDKEILTKALMSISPLGDYPDFINAVVTIALLNNELPQGSHLSPYLSNLVMLEFDDTLVQQMKLKNIPQYKYTRYADDITLSSVSIYKPQETIGRIQALLSNLYNNKINLNLEKTKILTNKGKLFITGVKINKDHQATYGHEKKSKLKHILCNLFIADKNNQCSTEMVQEILGQVSYMKAIEPDYTEYLVQKYLRMFNSSSITLHGHFNRYL